MIFSSIRSLFLIGSIFCIALSSCEQSQPILEKVTEALNRETPEEEAARTAGETGAGETAAVEDIPPPPEPVKMEPTINKEARVSILGYHDFTDGVSNNDMVINIDDFRDQMQAIHDAELPVISMQQFLDWRAGKKDIPAECMMITIDDGWKATHNLALQVLKDFGYPFTVFLYKNYVAVGGRSMTHQEVREIANGGGTLCSHSVSHQNMARQGGRSKEAYEEWLEEELVDSHDFLVETFGDTQGVLKTFAYPYGKYNEEVLRVAEKFGYEAGFTVNGKKALWDSPKMEIGRYIVHGKKIANFEPALNFGSGNVTSSGRKLIRSQKGEDGERLPPTITLFPPQDSTIKTRLPLIEANLSKLAGVQGDSLSMRVSGLGRVPHVYDSRTGIVSYQVPQRLRLENCGVQLSFRHAGNNDTELIAWNFSIDRLAEYLDPQNSAPENSRRVFQPASSGTASTQPEDLPVAGN